MDHLRRREQEKQTEPTEKNTGGRHATDPLERVATQKLSTPATINDAPALGSSGDGNAGADRDTTARKGRTELLRAMQDMQRPAPTAGSDPLGHVFSERRGWPKPGTSLRPPQAKRGSSPHPASKQRQAADSKAEKRRVKDTFQPLMKQFQKLLLNCGEPAADYCRIAEWMHCGRTRIQHFATGGNACPDVEVLRIAEALCEKLRAAAAHRAMFRDEVEQVCQRMQAAAQERAKRMRRFRPRRSR